MLDANQITVFDRTLVRRRRDRAAADFTHHDALFAETGDQLIDRLRDVKRGFQTALDLGSHRGAMAHALADLAIPTVIASDLSQSMAETNPCPSFVADEEFLPLAASSLDLIVSNLSLHWVNDLPGALLQIKNTLRPDGLFLAAVIGGRSLYELRDCLMEAELAITGGLSPRLSPTLELREASGLLQRAGFVLPVADQETITMTYPDLFALVRDLRGMGETYAGLATARRPLRRAVVMEAARLYHSRYAGVDGRIPATFEIIFLHGWKAGND